jgi:ribosome-binding factor A
MSVDRLERVNALLRRELAEAFFRVFASEGLDLAAITVTRVQCARNLRNATVHVSILGHERERGSILQRIARRHGDLQALINRDCHLKYTPRLEFRLDDSIAKGDRILDVLSHLDSSGKPDSSDLSDPPDQ